MRERKIVQLSQAPVYNDVSIFALCDDGTLWTYDFRRIENYGTPWKQCMPIPQPAPTDAAGEGDA